MRKTEIDTTAPTERIAKKTWKTAKDCNIRHVWSLPDGTGEITVAPAFYAKSGTPVCGEDTKFEGDDMVYVRTEICS